MKIFRFVNSAFIFSKENFAIFYAVLATIGLCLFTGVMLREFFVESTALAGLYTSIAFSSILVVMISVVGSLLDKNKDRKMAWASSYGTAAISALFFLIQASV